MPTDTITRDRMDPAVDEFLGGEAKKLLIGGRWVEARSGETFETVDPATERVIGHVAAGAEADVDAAVVAARAAFEDSAWADMPPHQRTKLLLRCARVLDDNAEELAQIETLDTGLTITSTRSLASRLGTVLEYYAGWATKIYGETNPSAGAMFNYTAREPLGVCGAIVPWNGPLMSAIWKIAPALACGNTVILKPAEQTPLSSVRLCELLQEAGVPDGVVNLVNGFGSTAGAALSNHPDVDKIAFTGSTGVGKQILTASAANMKRITLELGGKSPNIVFADADLDTAVAGAVRGFCTNAGQVCVAGSRIFVERSIHDAFVEKLRAAAALHRIGDPFASDTTMGPLVSSAQFEKVNGYVGVGLEDGAKLQLGGERFQGTGYYFNPTIFSDVSNDMRIAREEIFGPVTAVIPFDSEADVIRLGNDTELGLAAAVWTRDVARAHRVAKRLRAGSVWVNTYFQIDPISPFGGYKQSGLGRELGRHSIEAFTQVKSVWIDTAG